MSPDFFDQNSKEEYAGGIVFPPVPFQVYVSELDYADRHNLPFKRSLTVTNVRYAIAQRQVRYCLREAIFDFPWEHESIQILATYSTN